MTPVLKYDDLTEAQKNELRGKGITSIDLTGEVGDTKTYTITYADGLTFDFSVTDGHTPIFTFVGTVCTSMDGRGLIKGDKGDTGEKGADGTMSFEDLTPEQKESLKGEQGIQGLYQGRKRRIKENKEIKANR